jgi:uncharacterized protein (DUF1015 family)
MANVQPLRALRYDPSRTGGLQDVVSPPYDVIDEAQRRALEERSPYNVVHIDLPRGGDDRYAQAAARLARWREEAAVVLDEAPALWALQQQYVGPDGRPRARSGVLARVRVDEYGPGRIRPHERTHPGPREDRLRLTRATRANLSPIFSLYSDVDGSVGRLLEQVVEHPPWAETSDEDGTVNRLHRLAQPGAITTITEALGDRELLIADGHHRYETSRVYAEEVGGEGPHRYVLMCLVALEDPGLEVFPTHRLVRGLSAGQHEALDVALRRDFEIVELDDVAQLAPPSGEGVRIGYLDQTGLPRMLTLRDPAIADRALAGFAPAYRQLDTAVLEALVLKGPLGMTDEDIDHLDGLGYARGTAAAIEQVRSGEFEAAFFMAPTPVHRIRDIAAAGENMPPKSTYFFPKVPTGLLFNPLAE